MEHMHPVPGIVDSAASSRRYAPGFMTDLMAKDPDLALGHAADSQVPLLSSALVRQVLTVAQREGFGREDFSAIGKVIRELGGTP
jgi:3-hydroxyisobutyrate dehydrogenase